MSTITVTLAVNPTFMAATSNITVINSTGVTVGSTFSKPTATVADGYTDLYTVTGVAGSVISFAPNITFTPNFVAGSTIVVTISETASVQLVNLGSYANDGTGDDLRTAFEKINSNFSYISSEGAVVGGDNVGSGHGILSQKNPTTLNLEFKTLTSTDQSVVFTEDTDTLDLKANTKLESDQNPKLSNNLNLNNFYTYNGDAHTTVYGYDVPLSENILSVIADSSNDVNIDMGSFLSPAGYTSGNPRGYTIDFNGTGVLDGFNLAPNNDLDLGPIVIDQQATTVTLSSLPGTKAANASGIPGQISWDANYVYICVALNTWKRAALTGSY
jgi:hypothetical protein